MNNIVIGKRIPIGGAVNGAVLFGAEVYNVTHPELQISLAIAGGLAVTLTALVQILVVNRYGVTVKPKG